MLLRGGVLAGDSAGAITLGCLWLSYSAQADTLGKVTDGLCALPRVTVTPHVRNVDGDEITAEVQKYLATHPGLVGINITNGAALLVHQGVAEVLGSGGVTVFDATKDRAKPYLRLPAGTTRELNR